MVISTNPSRSDSETLKGASAETNVKSSDQVTAAEAAEELIATIAKPMYVGDPIDYPSLPVKLVRSIVAFYDDLGGPPMTRRDRVRRDIEGSDAERKYGPLPF